METIGTSQFMNRILYPFQANAIFQYSLKISENWGISIAEIDPEIAYPRYKFNITNFGIKRSVISSRLTELEILFYYALQVKINSLKWEYTKH